MALAQRLLIFSKSNYKELVPGGIVVNSQEPTSDICSWHRNCSTPWYEQTNGFRNHPGT
jgi:hypothetical protein